MTEEEKEIKEIERKLKFKAMAAIIADLKSGMTLFQGQLDKVQTRLEDIAALYPAEDKVTVSPENRSTLFDNLPKEKVTIRRVSEETETQAKTEQPKYNIQVVGLGIEKI